FIITSKLPWEKYQHDESLQFLFEFGPGSNIKDHVLIIANHYDEKEIIDSMKVGIDSSSHDHFKLTMHECMGKSVKLVEISYGKALQKLVTGEIDATVWDAGAGLHRQPSNFKTVTLSHHNRDSEANREAVLVVRSDDKS